MSYIVARDSVINPNLTLFMKDRTRFKDRWWTIYLSEAFQYENKSPAEDKVKSLRSTYLLSLKDANILNDTNREIELEFDLTNNLELGWDDYKNN
jgi:hypothetical protein